MCLVRVFIFIRKAEHMYEIFFILIWTENSLYPFVALHHFLISLLFPHRMTKPLHSKISIDAI